MMTAASLAALPTVAAPRASPQRGATGFSFDEAVAATRRNAARALDIHGGAPTDAVTRPATQAETPAKTPDAAAPDATAEASPQHARAAPHAAEAAETAPPAARAPSPVIAVNGQAAAISVAAPGAAAAPQTQTPAAIRDAAARTRTEAPRAAPPVRAPAQAVTQFAEILAQRLDGASQFDLRLDPPALGGIDGRLTLSDDGEALLSLAFDNQSAFDLFRRDEAALRSALASAGFDLSRHNLQMSFRAPAPARADAEALTEPAVQRPAFAPAPLHRGAVDIRA